MRSEFDIYVFISLIYKVGQHVYIGMPELWGLNMQSNQ